MFNIAFKNAVACFVVCFGLFSCSDDGESGANDSDASIARPDGLYTLAVSVGGEGQGQLTINGVICSDSPCVSQVEAGTEILIEAEPTLESSFVDSGICGGLNSCGIVVNSDLELNFAFVMAGALLKQTGLTADTNVSNRDTAFSDDGLFVIASGGQWDGSTILPLSIKKYSSAGEVIGEFQFTPSVPTYEFSLTDIEHMALDANGDIYIAFHSFYDLDASQVYKRRIYIYKLDGANGSLVWSTNIGAKRQMSLQDFFISDSGKVLWRIRTSNPNSVPNDMIFANDPNSFPNNVETIIGSISEAGGIVNVHPFIGLVRIIEVKENTAKRVRYSFIP